MTNISKAIRHKRFHVLEEHEVLLHIQSAAGQSFKMRVINCSLAGIGVVCEQDMSQVDGFLEGSIFPPAKLTWNGQEFYLGRLVLRTLQKKAENSCQLGFQAIDSKVPIDGPLSRVIASNDLDISTIYDFDLNPDKFSLATFIGSDQHNVDLFTRCKQFAILFRDWRETPKYQYRTVRQPSMGARVMTATRRRGNRNDYIIMGSNDYLGLASHPRVIEAAKNALDQYGFGSTGSPMTTGLSQIHEELTDAVSRIMKKEKAMLFNSGYAANLGILAGLTGEQDLIVADILSHASIADGMQMAKSSSRFFKHNDYENLDRVLQEERSKYAGCLVVTEGVFSMDGDVAPLDQIHKVATKHNARFMVDEAHSFGVIGPSGLGCAAKFSLSSEVDVIMGTFSKICGAIGGFVAADTEVIDWLYHLARAHVFSVSIPPSTAAAALEALKIFQEEKDLQERLKTNIRHFTDGLRYLGFEMNPNHESAVIPVTIGDEKILGKMNESLRDDGVFVVPIVYPAVSRNSCRFRFTIMATHSISDLDFVLGSLEKAMLKSGFRTRSEQVVPMRRVV